MATALQKPTTRRSTRQRNADAGTAAANDESDQDVHSTSGQESEIDELIDSDENNSDDEDESFRLDNTPTRQKSSKGRASSFKVPETPMSAEQDLDDTDDIDTLYGQILGSRLPTEKLVEEWIDKYKGPEKMEAVEDLVNLIIRSCGTKEKIDAKAIEDDELIVDALQNLEDKVSANRYTEYPIASKLRKYKSLKADLIDFWQKLIEECQYDIIYDGLLVETLQVWLTTMSSSTFRPFRHTATVIALNVISSLALIAERAVQEKAIANRQLGAERRKNNNNRASERQKMLEDKSKALANKEKRLNGYLKHFIDSIFVHRCRDVEAVIRMECIKHLGDWMEQYTSYFLDNQYLRYLGWLLNDKSTSRFKVRLVEMALHETDQTTRVQAIGLCVLLAESNVIDASDNMNLGSLIFSDQPKIRSSIAPLANMIFENDYLSPVMSEAKSVAATLPPTTTSTGRTRGVAQGREIDSIAIKFKCLVKMLMDYGEATQKVKKPNILMGSSEVESVDNQMELDASNNIAQVDQAPIGPQFENICSHKESRIALAVGSLFKEISTLQEWKAMVDFLLKDYTTSTSDLSNTAEDSLNEYYQLTDEEDQVFIEIAVAVISLFIDQSVQKSKTKKKNTHDEDTKNQISRHIALALPRLISKYAADGKKITHILVLPQLINLSAYTDLRMSKAYEQLLEDTKKMFMRHTTSTVHLNAALVIKRLTSYESMLSVAEPVLIELRDELSLLLHNTFSDKDMQAQMLSEEALATIAITLSRIQQFIKVMDVTEILEDQNSEAVTNLSLILQVLERGKSGNIQESETILSSAAILFQFLAWKCHQVLTDNDIGGSRVDLSRLIVVRDSVIHTLTDLCLSDSALQVQENVRKMSFQLLVDLYWLFSNEQFRHQKSSDDISLMLRCTPNLQKTATEYVDSELNKWEETYAIEAGQDEDDEQDELSDNGRQHESAHVKIQYERLTPVAALAKACMLGIFDVNHAVTIVSRYRNLGIEVDEVIKALVSSVKDGLNIASTSKLPSSILTMYMDSLKESFERHTKLQDAKLDKTLQLARLLAGSIKAADSDPFHKTSPDLLTDDLHIPGITYCTSRASSYSKNGDQDSRAASLKFFKILTTFSSLLTRARDVAKIHRHLDSVLEQYELSPETSDKDWDAYKAYISSIDTVLQKKGLRYDASNKNNMDSAQQPLGSVDQNRANEFERLQPNALDQSEEDDEPLQRGRKNSKKPANDQNTRGTKRKAEIANKQTAKQIRLSDMLEKS
ncbi:hypothetical protein INT43_005526 [Umbelopsis isabellina]|uniref:SCD domain-containing protein n=1 Tax=Mortierella isabellina TaxID=91625 RepID=A0A8H7PLK3_MORIS|nr:hypothetical protein INT43_005526 [Umbelopsis isabellina]